MKNRLIRGLAALLALTLTFSCAALAEDEEISQADLMIEEEVMLEDDDNLLSLEDMEEVRELDIDNALEDDDFDISSLFDDETNETLSIIDEELDTSIVPDDLELNPNLPDHIVNILLIGIDSRSREMAKGEQLGDVQICLSIDKNTGSIKMTSFLRDLYVTIPGYKNKSRLNVSYARGGGQLAMRTINRNFELNIQYYAVINFFGLASIIDALGGVDIEMTRTEAVAINAYLREHPPAYDNKTEKRVALERKSGVQHCDGVQAVMYARLRKVDNDFNRTARQRKLLEILLGQVMQDVDFEKLLGLMDTAMDYCISNMPGATMLELAMRVMNSGIIQKAKDGETLFEQFRIPLDKLENGSKGYAYYATKSGQSVVNLSKTKWPLTVKALHEFIYGEYIPAK